MDYIWTLSCLGASNMLQQTANRYFGDVHDTNPAIEAKKQASILRVTSVCE
jgi:hypothetical protein